MRPDSARAADLGVTPPRSPTPLRIATSGDYDQALPKLNLPSGKCRSSSSCRAKRAGTGAAEAADRTGARRQQRHPRQRGAALDRQRARTEIDRYDRRRNVNFEIELNQRPLGEVEAQALALPSLRSLPPGVIQTTVGDAEAMNELFRRASASPC